MFEYSLNKPKLIRKSLNKEDTSIGGVGERIERTCGSMKYLFYDKWDKGHPMNPDRKITPVFSRSIGQDHRWGRLDI